jgi:hypothetical protein
MKVVRITPSSTMMPNRTGAAHSAWVRMKPEIVSSVSLLTKSISMPAVHAGMKRAKYVPGSISEAAHRKAEPKLAS